MADTLTLDQIEPYEPLDYNAPDAYQPPESDLVEGRMTGILSSGSPYMESARASGIQQAQSRGMLNTDLSGQFSEQAAIGAALPIAQQDSTSLVNAGMAGYQNELDAGLTDFQAQASSQLSGQEAQQSSLLSGQGAEQTSELSGQEYVQSQGLTSLEAGLTSDLSLQEALQASGLSAQEALQQIDYAYVNEGISSRLSDQDYQQLSKLSEQEAEQTSDLSTQEFGQNTSLQQQNIDATSALSKQEAGQTLSLSDQQALDNLDLAQKQAELAGNLSEQEAGYKQELQTQIDTAEKTRQDAEIQANKDITSWGLSSSEATAMGAAVTLLGQDLSQQISEIEQNADLDPTAKGTVIAELQAQYTANVESVSNIYGVDLEWV